MNYEQRFRNQPELFGAPSTDICDFFCSLTIERATILDLGCGQGRDALFAARKGHRVHGVDISPTGIDQMIRCAELEGLAITGEVADIVLYTPVATFDDLLIDRVLHMLIDDMERAAVLNMACRHTHGGGFVFVADTVRGMGMVRAFFSQRSRHWKATLDRKSSLLAVRTS